VRSKLTLTCCVMDLLATSLSSTPPMKTCTVWLVTNCEAMAFTSLGQVAEKNSVWRSRGSDRTIFWICGQQNQGTCARVCA
jgi:hypothetical protein